MFEAGFAKAVHELLPTLLEHYAERSRQYIGGREIWFPGRGGSEPLPCLVDTIHVPSTDA